MTETERTPNQIIAAGLLATAHLFAVLSGPPWWNTAHLILVLLWIFSGFHQGPLRLLAALTLGYFFAAFDEMPGTFFLLTTATVILAFDLTDKKHLRLALFLGYFLAFFHKLNRDFLDPALSCAADALTLAPFLRSWLEVTWLREILPWVALTVEGFMAFALWRENTVKLSFAVAVLFHLAMSPAEIYAIPQILMLLFSGFFLFPAAGMDTAKAGRFVIVHLVLAFPFIWRKILRSLGQPFPNFLFGHGFDSVYWLLLISNALVILHFAWTVFASRAQPLALSFPEIRRARSSWILAGVMLFWGFQPYLGLTTTHSMIMHSNLRTEQNSNHLLLGWLPPVFHFQKDAVSWDEYHRMMSSCAPHQVIAGPLFTPLAEFGHVPFGTFQWIPRFEAEKRAAVCRGEALGWSRFLIFRPYDSPGPNRCRK